MADSDLLPSVPLDDATLKRMPQTGGADGMLPSVGPGDRLPLDTVPSDTYAQGTAKNAATGAIKGTSWIRGTPGDLRSLANRGFANVASLFSDKTTEQLHAEYEKHDREVGEKLAKFSPLVSTATFF